MRAVPQLRFLTCGSIDDGKSTLIDRLLHDAKTIFDDQQNTLQSDSKNSGTIDVAYRYFATPNRSFIVTDASGQEQYTRNMATGAPMVDLAVILVDARQGVVTQTKRHTYIAHLLGIKSITLVINKMDLVDYNEDVFLGIVSAYKEFADQIGVSEVTVIPVSVLHGENISSLSKQMPWYKGSCVLEHLETVEIIEMSSGCGARLPVQRVSRPNAFSGVVAGGPLSVGDPVTVEPDGAQTTVAEISTTDGSIETVLVGQSVTVALNENIDVSRGNVIRHSESEMEPTDQIQGHLIWMSDIEMIPGRQYGIKLGTCSALTWVSELKYKVNMNTLEHTAAKTLELNDVAVCNLSFDRRLACEPYTLCKETGGFTLIDRDTNETVGAGMVDFALRRARNLTRQMLTLDKMQRAKAMGQSPALLWFTGLSGSGKSTVANVVEARLHHMGRRTYMLDGDNVRHGLNRDLGFTDADRVENIRRIAETAKLFVDAGMIVLVSAISPFRGDRDMARALMDDGEFFEVHIDASLETCEQRDPKGLYSRARAGEIANFTGIDSPYEVPLEPELRIDTDNMDPETAANKIIMLLTR